MKKGKRPMAVFFMTLLKKQGKHPIEKGNFSLFWFYKIIELCY
jgi:hypothetical protein